MSLSRLIRLCGEKNSIFNGKAIHARITVSGSNPDVQTNNHLLAMYGKLGDIDYAQKLFDEMPVRNVVSWTSLISSYSQLGFSEQALDCFRSLVVDDGIAPNNYTYVSALSACAGIRASRAGKEIHGHIFRAEENVNSFVESCLVNFYGKCGLLKSARLVFDSVREPNTATCVSLIASCVDCGENEEGLRVFLRSFRMGVKVNEFTYASTLSACAVLEDLRVGRQVQCLAFKCGVRMDQFVVTNLVNFYAKCGEWESACRAFREADRQDVTAWTALIGGCMQLEKSREAIDLFREFLFAGLRPTEQTFSSVLGAFGKEKEIRGGVQLHCWTLKLGLQSFTFVSNALLDFYAKIHCFDESYNIFCEMVVHDVVGWNALIAGYVDSGHLGLAVEFVQNMLREGFDPNLYTFSSILSICANLPAVEWGKQTHCHVIKPGLDSNLVVGSALVNMYAKCGRLNDAQKVFNNLPIKNLVSWNAMITGYAQHGLGTEALQIYDLMLGKGIKPDDVTFIGVLSACGHAGLLEEALHHFDSMTKDFAIIPKVDHLACIVSLFSRKGQTKAAYDFMRCFPGEPSKVVWRCLLSGCITNNDLDLAKYAAEAILRIDPDDASAHVMLSNIYADSKLWNETSQVKVLMKEKALKKETGYSWI